MGTAAELDLHRARRQDCFIDVEGLNRTGVFEVAERQLAAQVLGDGITDRVGMTETLALYKLHAGGVRGALGK